MRAPALLLIAACGGGKAAPSNHVGPRKPAGPITHAKLLGADDLAARGATVKKINDHESLVCGDDCICLTDLGCEGGECMTLDQNLAIFRKALDRDYHTVDCNLADIGKLCDLQYFRFDGDIYRYEIRYFGPDGRLVGQSNTTDYPEYCEGQAMRQFSGRIPDCKMKPWDVEIICSEDSYRNEAGWFQRPLGFVFSTELDMTPRG